MLPITIFPALTVCTDSTGKVLKDADNHVSFKALNNQAQNGMRSQYVFNAFDSVADRIRRMKMEGGSQITVIAEMRDYIDKDNKCRQSFNIIKIDFIRIDESARKNEGHSNDNDNESQHDKKTKKQPQPDKKAADKASSIGTIDIEKFQRMFG